MSETIGRHLKFLNQSVASGSITTNQGVVGSNPAGRANYTSTYSRRLGGLFFCAPVLPHIARTNEGQHRCTLAAFDLAHCRDQLRDFCR